MAKTHMRTDLVEEAWAGMSVAGQGRAGAPNPMSPSSEVVFFLGFFSSLAAAGAAAAAAATGAAAAAGAAPATGWQAAARRAAQTRADVGDQGANVLALERLSEQGRPEGLNRDVGGLEQRGDLVGLRATRQHLRTARLRRAP